MTLHLLKLAVGIDALPALAARQKQRLKDMARDGLKPELVHITRQTPRRGSEMLQGGSIYWVIKGWITARQTLLDLRPLTRDGIAHCGIVYDQQLVPVALRPHRAFQGWRYLEEKDAPPDVIKRNDGADLPDDLRRELIGLGLL